MKATINTDVQFDLLHSTDEIAEIAKVAAIWGFRMIMEPSDDEGFPDARSIRLIRLGPVFFDGELARLVMLLAMARGQSPESVLKKVTQDVGEFGIDVTKPLSDQRPIGA